MPEGLLSDLCTRAQAQLDGLTPSRQAALLGGLASLGYVPRAAFVKQFLERSRAKLSGMPPEGYARMIGALADYR